MSTTMYKDIWPFSIIDLDAIEVSIPEFPTKVSKRSIVFINEPIEIKSRCKILIVPFCGCKFSVGDIEEIEYEMLKFAEKKEIDVNDTNAYRIVKEIKRELWHGFAII